MYRKGFLLVNASRAGVQNTIWVCWVPVRTGSAALHQCIRSSSFPILEAKSQRQFRTSAATSKEKDLKPSSDESGTAQTAADEQEKITTRATGASREGLLNLIGGMKVEVSKKKRFLALKMQKAKESRKDPSGSLESASSMFQKATSDIKSSSQESLSPELVAAASAVASSMPLNLKRQTESELLKQLRKHEAETESQKSGESSNISNIIADMKIGKHPVVRAAARPANQIRFDDDGRGYVPERGVVGELDGVRRRKGLYGGKRLNIFSVSSTDAATAPQTELTPTLWDIELANEVAAVVQRPPRNGFEEVIQWTTEGKLWQFPINNEAGLEEEQNVEFYEHIFLEKHLEDFPKHGPIRHFMELVITGLSKNPYLTVQQKLGHIEWFRSYFQEKEDILKESNVYLN